MLQRFTAIIFLSATCLAAMAQTPADKFPAEKSWIKQSNDYTNLLLRVQLEHSPEEGSAQGVAKFDALISNPSRADEIAARHELEAALAKIKAAQAGVTDENVKEDIEILQKAFNLQFRREDFAVAREVPFYNASAQVFRGLRVLLDDQVPAQRRSAALARLRKYAGVEPGYKPFTDRLKERGLEQIAKPNVIFPSKEEVETDLGRNSNYVEGIAALFKKYNLSGWEPAYAKLQAQLADYDAWVRSTILPQGSHRFSPAP